jgi:hypothetical protein
MIVGDDVVAARDRLGDEAQCLVFDLRSREGDEGDPEDVCIRAAQLVFADRVLGGQDIADRFAGFLRFLLSRVEILIRNEAGVGEEGFEMGVGNVHVNL